MVRGKLVFTIESSVRSEQVQEVVHNHASVVLLAMGAQRFAVFPLEVSHA